MCFMSNQTPFLDQAYFLILFDEFKDVPAPKITAFIAMASRLIDARIWGDRAQDAAAYLTAHLLKSTGGIGGSGGGAGPITSESVGSLSRSYGMVGSPGSDQDYNRTLYGQRYIALRNSTIIAASVTGTDAHLRAKAWGDDSSEGYLGGGWDPSAFDGPGDGYSGNGESASG